MKTYWVYIMASESLNLYTGVTGNLQQAGLLRNVRRHFAAIRREKQIKGWLRVKKIALIESINRDWKDLSDGW